jgi:predicted nucleic acid-binding protein
LIETKQIIISKVAVDTNVLIFLYDDVNTVKRGIAVKIVSQMPIVSSQVVSEYLNVTKRILKIPKKDIIRRCINLFEDCKYEEITVDTLKNAEKLILKYDFQMFDAIIIAAALQARCSTLYSEDM